VNNFRDFCRADGRGAEIPLSKIKEQAHE